MPKAKKSDIPLMIDILTQSFVDNPSANWVLKDDNKKLGRLRELCRYSILTAMDRDGAYISEDKLGVALCYQKNIKKEGIKDWLRQIRLVVKSMGLKKAIEAMKRESTINKQRPNDGNFLYFWFLGVLPNKRGLGSAISLKNEIMKEAQEKGLDIYLETSVPQNKRVYERYGFKTYHTWKIKDPELEMWFLKYRV